VAALQTASFRNRVDRRAGVRRRTDRHRWLPQQGSEDGDPNIQRPRSARDVSWMHWLGRSDSARDAVLSSADNWCRSLSMAAVDRPHSAKEPDPRPIGDTRASVYSLHARTARWWRQRLLLDRCSESAAIPTQDIPTAAGAIPVRKRGTHRVATGKAEGTRRPRRLDHGSATRWTCAPSRPSVLETRSHETPGRAVPRSVGALSGTEAAHLASLPHVEAN